MPVFLFPVPEDRGLARAHLPGFTCWVASSALDQALAGELDALAGMALAKSCDTMQGLTDLWRRNVPSIPLFHFGMPIRLDGPAAREYLLAELRSLRERVEAQVGWAISDDDLRESIALYNRTRARVRDLYGRASQFDPRELYALVRTVFQQPKEAFEEAGSRMQAPSPSLSRSFALSLFLVGPSLGDPVLFDVIAGAGARVGGDLFDLGERYFAIDAAEEGDALEALADRLLALVPTPTKYRSQRSRADFLLSLVRERGACGVVFARQKFCDPHGFDYAQMVRALDGAGVPHLLVELEQASQAGQLRTRVEAFVEMLHA
ncbi:MAG: 2-hydroxyacyl-CoA dehydratase [Anaerolineae bacterium]|nr:2-hydroxyacyl-CoA dehydratase [Anaerolineae bacterium]